MATSGSTSARSRPSIVSAARVRGLSRSRTTSSRGSSGRSRAPVRWGRASASDHRASAQRTEWEEEFDKLVALFGDGLAGLSGLELA